MWCKKCNIETNESVCPVCGSETIEDTPVEVYWCKHCKTPIIQFVNQMDKGACPLCGRKTKYLSADLRPVFPEERLLIELLLGKKPNEWIECSVWASNSRYYIDGKSVSLSSSLFQNADTDLLSKQLEEYKSQNGYEFFESNIQVFIEANRDRLCYLKDEAFAFINQAAQKYDPEHIVVSFSGGKDSTVTADLAVKGLSNPCLVHIFGNTTLEFPSTIEYANRFRDDHPQAIFQLAQNYEQVFLDVCEDIGPPARMMRWCCSMFKTGPITRVINSLYRNQQILTFYGIRKSESVSRSKYNRIEDNSESVKIQQQTVASPIFFWKDIDIWLYILSEDIDFNDAYRLGYDRVGCMGRKKKEFPPSKEVNFHFRMTKELYEVLQTETVSADMTLSDYVRKLLTSRKPIIKKRIEVVFNDPEILQIFRNLGACGNNLNQIAAYLNDSGTMTNQMWKDIKECISELYEMRDTLKEMVGEYHGCN